MDKKAPNDKFNNRLPEAEPGQIQGGGANKMGTAPIGPLLASMAWPAMLSMTMAALYNIVDSIFVAMLSKDALAAVSYAMPIQMLMIAMGVGSAVGVNSLIARRLGARRYEEAGKAASTSVRIALFNYSVFLFIGLFLAGPLMHAFTDDEVIYQYSVTYLRIVTCFSFASMIEVQLEKVLQATGNMKAPMIMSISGIIVNVILDPVLIFGLVGMPRLGIAGAAIATVIGQAVSMIVGIVIFRRKEHDVKIQLKGFKIDWKIVRDIYAVGLPGIIMQSIGSFMHLGFNAIIAANATAVTILGIYFKLQSFIFLPVFGLNQGAMPIMGYNYGARNKARLMQTYRYALAAAVVIMSIGLAVFQLKPELLLKMFSADDEMLEIGVPALRLISLCFLPAAYGIICSTTFQSTGHGMYSLFSSLIRQLVGILPIAYFLYNNYGVLWCWAAFPLAELLGTTYVTIMFIYLYRKEIRNL